MGSLQRLSGGWNYSLGVDYLYGMLKPLNIWYQPHKNNSQNKQKQSSLPQQNNQPRKENSPIFNNKKGQTHCQEFTKASWKKLFWLLQPLWHLVWHLVEMATREKLIQVISDFVEKGGAYTDQAGLMDMSFVEAGGTGTNKVWCRVRYKDICTQSNLYCIQSNLYCIKYNLFCI